MIHSNVFVRDVPLSFTTEDMRHAFEHFGPILSVKILEPRKIGDKRFGFIKFSTMDQAKMAIESMNGITMKGHKLEVREAEGDVNNKKKVTEITTENDNLFVRGFPTTWNLEDLARYFSRIGVVVAVKILGSKHPNRGAVGLVKYSSVLEAKQAIMMLKGEYIDTYGPIEIKYATVKDQSMAADSSPSSSSIQTQIMCNSSSSSPGDQTMTTTSISEYDSFFLSNGNVNANVNSQNQLYNNDISNQNILVNEVQEQKSPKTLFLCNLSPTVTKLTLYELFAPFGAITSILLGLDENFFCTGIAFVIFSDDSSAIHAKESLHGTFVRNSLISVNIHD